MLGLRVQCSKDGCDWEGELGELKRHLSDNCLYVKEVCPYGCGQSYPRHLLKSHKLDECPQRPLEVKLKTLQRHFQQQLIRQEEKHEEDKRELQQQLIQQEKKHEELQQQLAQQEKKREEDKKELQQQLAQQEKKREEDKKELQQQLVQQEKKHKETTAISRTEA